MKTIAKVLFGHGVLTPKHLPPGAHRWRWSVRAQAWIPTGQTASETTAWGRDNPIQGEWYWVTDGRCVWPAIACKLAAGGWSNGDTWEDFDGDVKQWQRIPRPQAPKNTTEDAAP